MKEVRVNNLQNKIWTRVNLLIVTAMVLCGSIGAFYRTLSGIENRMGMTGIIIGALAGMISCEIEWNLNEADKARWLSLAAPWIVVLTATGFHGYFGGMKSWINGIINRWNQMHEGGMALFGGSMTEHDLQAFCLLLSVFIGQLVWFMVTKGHTAAVWIWGILWVSLTILCGAFFAPVCSFLICGLIGMCIAGRELRMNLNGFVWFCALAVLCMTGSVFIPNKDQPPIEKMRDRTKVKVHEIRYGKEKLPAGDLSQADSFQKNPQKMLTVTSAQEKNLYMKAYVGGVYRNGEWDPMPESEYGGDAAGMLQWLKKKNFDPLMQSAAYYRLSHKSDLKENKVKVNVSGGSRDHFYSVGTLNKVLDGKVKEKRDYGLAATGLTGEREYTFSEISGSKPAELTVADSWVQNPKTKKQKEYSEAEAVYRNFVYEHYTTVDKEMYRLVNRIFWSDYNTESDGIYSALTQIRKKLKEEYTYTKTPETGEKEDVLTWFLKESHSGNAMLYASAAVEAFRAHGIPARYVEGYYVPATAIASGEDGHVLVSGEDMHAWAEVYFDGIGWLAVDVTPGYYYDVASLQKMVNAPDQVQKNAALKDNSFGGKQTSDMEGTREKVQKQAKKQIKNITVLILGIVAVLLICLTICIMIMEMGQLFLLQKMRRKYIAADGKTRITILGEEIFLVLKCMGIEAHLGWNTKETDHILAERFVQYIKSGEYIKVCRLLEKQIYGELELEPYEERTINRFLEKLLQAGRLSNWKVRWKIHQRHFAFAILNR